MPNQVIYVDTVTEKATYAPANQESTISSNSRYYILAVNVPLKLAQSRLDEIQDHITNSANYHGPLKGQELYRALSLEIEMILDPYGLEE